MSADPSVILHTDRPAAALAVLEETHPDLTVHCCDSYAALPELIGRVAAEVVYSVRFDGTPRYPRQALVESPSVKWVSVGGSGTDHLGSWDPERLTVTNAAGVAAGMLAEYALGAMLSFSLDLRGFERRRQARQWGGGRVEPIEGKTVLIIGLGKTGTAVASRAQAMGIRTLGIRARPKAMDGLDEVHGPDALPTLLGRADFIVCCVPLLSSTRGLLGAAAFAAMKPSSVLIDISRGGVVDEAALLAALDNKRIKGAALDVFATEPLPAGHPLWGYESVAITPHCAAVYDGWDIKSVRMFADNLKRYRGGAPLENVVSPERGY
ncbi:D-2-hydroxyacid dehydrogenase [Mesorhizobium sp. M7A.F.Ca.CA.001.07.2.1]|uniref:D-2-hydroxyacid dehydrogenase n=1 Tax=Mesorhizobium TaxID=68287 RepID=UPI000FC9D9B7|nr:MULTISPECIES: D-2-hydroxyacid dehydrogenase [Mesorhizobium]MCF6121664.1 D-2-hydroxyacid dehydrogenase [Mesorhizobium ciceri]MCQ8812243.1 D-2-hydroxyacid dehydrogenase [Mesorhizobium sp. SEMIA396]RUX70541.1 D-2-hydroxyacid dehydrogenase [Mesorhizobium sp. M7A.F.Ca.CA.004.08.2.1]RUX89853.1 D-2-hydroxyacid dehydrogenase [Mesorhizobium sp. M7A.F.Ca.CA.004.08.1.1]RUY06619.1 D-2-hydroxyacid dehydrogenase [Mesorhizobium sp. M7A.F.Ca.CA.004.04.1.1]